MGEKRHPWLDWLVLALCLLSLIRGVYQLGEQSLWWDESLSLHRASRSFPFILSNSVLFLYGDQETPATPDFHPPLYFALLRIVIRAAGSSEFALRFLSLAACVLIVPLVYQCGRYLFDPTSGVLAALLAACAPLYLWAQQEARPYALATLFTVISFYALLRVLVVPASGQVAASRPARQWGWAGLYVLSAGAMIVTHYHTLQLLPAHAAILILSRGRRTRRAWWALLAVGLVAGGVALYAAREIMPPLDIPTYYYIPLGTLLQDVLRAFPLGVSGTHLVLYQCVALGLLLAAVVLLFARREASVRRGAAYLLLCLVLPVAEIYVLSYVRPAYLNIRHLIFASPFYFLVLGAGAAQVRHVRLGRAARAAVGAIVGTALVLLLVGMGLSTHAFFADPYYDKEDHRGWGRYLSEHVRPGDVVFVYPGAVYELYNYYASSPTPYYGLPLLGASPEQTVRHLVDLAEHYDRLWVAHSLTPGWAYEGDTMIPWLQENALSVASAEFHGHLNTFPAYAFRLEPPVVSALPEEVTPLDLDYDGQLHLLGYRSIAEPMEVGHPLLLSLYWSAARPLDQDVRFTLSLTDERGNTWASLDYVPYRGTYPPARWPVGGIVRDDIDIDIPVGTPPGRYSLNVSVYPDDGGSPALPVREMGTDRLMGLIVPVGETVVARPADPPRGDEVDIPRRTRRRYGDLALLGHDYQGSSFRPGDVAYLDLYWRAIRAPRRDQTFSLQLVDADGNVRATRPIEPVDGYPASQWQRGELVRGKHRFRIPLDVPAGDYTLWLAPDGEGLVSSIWPWSDRRTQLGTLTVRPVEHQVATEIPPMQVEVRAILDDKVELLGYDLEEDTVRPGKVVSCTLYWRALQEMDRDYTVFTHLVAPDGTAWGQWDNQPQGGASPTTRWVPGQVVVDRYRVPVSADAPVGPLVLYVGMYDLLTMSRLPVVDASGAPIGDAIPAAEIQVVDVSP